MAKVEQAVLNVIPRNSLHGSGGISGGFSALRSWVHAGEDGAVVIYPHRNESWMGWVLAWAGLFVILINYPTLWRTCFALTALNLIFQRRRALIFSKTEVVYRPALGPPRRVLLTQIISIHSSTVAIATVFLRELHVPGVVLELSNGERCAFPLEARNPREALERLREATGKEVGRLEGTVRADRLGNVA